MINKERTRLIKYVGKAIDKLGQLEDVEEEFIKGNFKDSIKEWEE